MNHYYHKIEGWSDFIIPFYEHMVATSHNGATFVEVGVWKGRSICYLATEIIRANKAIFVYAVDTWRGSEEHQIYDTAINQDLIYKEYLNNIVPVKEYIHNVRANSVEASKMFFDESLDLVMLDANHGYEEVLKDIQAWWPKVRPGGILAGDDYDANYWPTVCDAVHKQFGLDDIHLFYKGTIWFKIKR